MAAAIGTAALFLVPGGASLAEEISVSRPAQFTENRGWNGAGLSPRYQIIVNARIAPAGYPTLVYVEQGNVREPAVHFPLPNSPDLYAYWRDFDPAFAGPWRIVAERGEARTAPVWTPALARPQKLPLMHDVRVKGRGTEPRLSWTPPRLEGFSVTRIRVGVRGGQRIHDRFWSLLYVSPDLPPKAGEFTFPPGVLVAGERYIFQVMLEDLEGTELKNRSLTFSEVYVPARQ